MLSVIATTSNSVTLQWRVEDIGGAALHGYTLTYRKEFGDWEEIQLDRRINSHMLENLQCGSRYQFTVVTFNKIGSSSTSAIETAKTKGILIEIYISVFLFFFIYNRKQTHTSHQKRLDSSKCDLSIIRAIHLAGWWLSHIVFQFGIQTLSHV